ncbi:phage baseplate assembly protein V [Methylomagnum ishizawai]|uniref:phage baseplate assembly protein V n=1 Tax=Methylomagnum ishizawai TaxID=1760988 RepID=UPI001C808738|nr:phage baseplate assembly protein V [Methylomagnum ishizawai]
MRDLLNAMRTQAALVGGGKPAPRFGVVSAYDPDAYAVRVLLDPEDPATETGWMPLASPAIGNGWGLLAGPSLGDQVEVGFLEDDPEQPYAAGRIYSDTDRPTPDIDGTPTGCPSGEIWLVAKGGARLRLLAGGAVEIVGTTVKIKGGTIESEGDWRHTGTITASVDVVADGISLHDHTHGGVQTGGGDTGVPQ